MPKMRVLRLGSVDYEMVGSASVTQTLTSGTEIATVTIDGTSTKLYAPSGGGGGSTVTVTQVQSSGTKIATVTVDSVGTDLYAPDAPVSSVNGQTGAVALSIPSKTSDLTNDSGFITDAGVTSFNGSTGAVTYTAPVTSVNGNTGAVTVQEGTEMVVLSYGTSTWADFEAAYPNAVVYCRASSNSDPASGAQTRMAFMAYVNSEDAPTEVEFQYYRSVSSHSATQQGDQVFVYKLNKTNGWSVTVREAYTRITAGTGMTQSYSGGILTLQAPRELPTVTSSDNGKVLQVVDGAWAAASLPSANGVSF